MKRVVVILISILFMACGKNVADKDEPFNRVKGNTFSHVYVETFRVGERQVPCILFARPNAAAISCDWGTK